MAFNQWDSEFFSQSSSQNEGTHTNLDMNMEYHDSEVVFESQPNVAIHRQYKDQRNLSEECSTYYSQSMHARGPMIAPSQSGHTINPIPIFDIPLKPSNMQTLDENTTSFQHHPQHTAGKGGRNKPKGRMPREKTTSSGRYYWDTSSVTTLLECKKAYDDRRKESDLYQKIKTIEEQWMDIVALCALRGVAVDWKQAYEKWKRLSLSFREISDWERNIPSGKDSYWIMNARQRQAEGKFSHCNFDPDVFELMEHLFGQDRVVNPTINVMDSNNGISNASPIANATTEQDVDEPPLHFEKTPTNSGIPRKARKRTHTYDVGLQDATKNLMKGLELAEEGKKARHEDLMKLEERRIEASMQFAANIATGFQVLGNAMNKLAEK